MLIKTHVQLYDTCRIIYIADIKTKGTVVLAGSKANLTCTVTGSKVTPSDISWKEGSNVYKDTATTPGFKVTKVQTLHDLNVHVSVYSAITTVT